MAIRKISGLWWKITLTVFVLFIVGIISLNYWAKARVVQEIENLSGKKLKGLYTVKIGKTHADIWAGEVQANDISVESDTAVWNKLVEGNRDSLLPLLSMTVRSIQIRHFNWIQYFTRRKVSIRSVVLDQPEFRMTVYRDTAAANISLKERLLKLPSLIAPVAATIKVRNMSVNNASVFLYTIQGKGDTLKQQMEQADLYINTLNIDKRSSEITYCKDIEVRAKHVATVFNVGTQKISFDDFTLSKNGRQIAMHNFQVDPQRSEQQFFKDIGVRKAYFTVKCPEILLQGVDLDRWLGYDYFHAQSMRLQEPVLHFTINKSLPLPYRKLLPHELIAGMKGFINIEEVVVKDGHIVLTNRVPGQDFDVTFNHAYITANNFSNDSTLMDVGHPLEIWAEARLMDEALIKLKMNVPLLSGSFDADYSASVDGLSLSVLNPVLSHKNMSITSGYMRSAEIRSVIRNGVANGKVVMQYRGLEIEIMKKETGKPRKFVSKIANILLNEDNMKADSSAFITGEISLVRNRQEEFFAFLWHSIQTGLLPTLLPAYDRLNLKPKRK